MPNFEDEILEKFEKLRYVVSTPAKKYKHPSKLVKEFLRTGRNPDLYENAEKEYKISQKGLNQFRISQKNNSNIS